MNALRPGAVRIALVHRAFGAVSTARHARFRGRHPPCADRGVPSHQGERERDSCETLDEPHHGSRMLDRGDAVKPEDNELVRRLLAAAILILFASLNAIDGICCPDGCTHECESTSQHPPLRSHLDALANPPDQPPRS